MLVSITMAAAQTADWFCLQDEPPAPSHEARETVSVEDGPVGLVPVGHSPGRAASWGSDYVDLRGTRWSFDAVLAALELRGQGAAVATMVDLEARVAALETSRKWQRRPVLERMSEKRRLIAEQSTVLAAALCAVNTGVSAPLPPVAWEAEIDLLGVWRGAMDASGRTARMANSSLSEANTEARATASIGGLPVEVYAIPGAVDAAVGWRVAAGSFDDGAALWGTAHLAEHLLFRHPGYVDWVTDRGGSFNGETWEGAVRLYATVPAADLGELLVREIDRMRSHRFTEAEYRLDLDIVAREEDFRSALGGVGHQVEGADLYALAFGRAPPNPLPRGSSRDVRSWLDTHLRPGALQLVVATPYAIEDVLGRLRERLEAQPWPAGEAPAPARWTTLDNPIPLLQTADGGAVALRSYVVPRTCVRCRESAVRAVGLAWLESLGGARLSHLATSRAGVELEEKLSAMAHVSEEDLVLHVRDIHVQVWDLGSTVVVETRLATGDATRASANAAELARLPELFSYQPVISQADLDALRGWHTWVRDLLDIDPTWLVRRRLGAPERSLDSLDEPLVGDVTADQVQRWVAAVLASPPARQGRRP